MTAVALPRSPTAEADESATAAAIRRIVTLAFIRREIDTDGADPDTALALPLLLHLRPGRYPEAAMAHRALVKQVRSDLLISGIATPEYLRLIGLLYHYLDAGGFLHYYESGRWENHKLNPGVIR